MPQEYRISPKQTSEEIHFIGYPTATIKTKTEWVTPVPHSIIEECIKKEMIIPYIMAVFIKGIALSGIGLSIAGIIFVFVWTGSLFLVVPFFISLIFTGYTYFKYGKA